MSKLFKALNHPQQVNKRGADDSIDDRSTPPDLFKEWDDRFQFTLDAAASALNTKCSKFFTKDTNGLLQSWAGESVWCNPPYSNIRPWVEKALNETQNHGCKSVVMLLPANRTEQGWWQDLIEPLRDQTPQISTHFVRRRRNFGSPSGEKVIYKSSPPFGVVIVIFRGDGK